MNERVAFGDDLNHFPQENTTILNSKFLILNSLARALNRNFGGFAFVLAILLKWGYN